MNNSDWDQQNECSECLGKNEDDIIDDKLQNEWICCSGCGNWMHTDCLVAVNSVFVCVLRNYLIKRQFLTPFFVQ